MAITETPNVGLQVPDYNTRNWQVAMNYNLNLIDQLLSGQQTLTGLGLIEALRFAASHSDVADTSVSRLSAGVLGIGNGTPGDASAELHAGAFVGSAAQLTQTLSVLLNGTSVGRVASLNFQGGMQASLVGSQINVQPTLAWQKFSITMSGANWLVNGTNVAAKATSGAFQNIPLFTAAAKQTFHGLVIKPTTVFTGALAGQCTLTVGSTASPDNLMLYAGDNFDLTQAVASTTLYNAGGSKVIDFSATSIVARIFVNASSASALTGGAVEVYVLTSLLP